MQQKITRAQARASGADFYFTGKPCCRGGIAARRVVGGKCLCDLCAKARSEAERTPHRVALAKARMQKWQAANVEAERERKRGPAEVARKKLAVLSYNPERSRAYYLRNRESRLDYARKWFSENPEKRVSMRAKRRAVELQRVPSWFGEFDQFVMTEAASVALARSAAAGVPHHVDHMVPLRARKASGLHCALNLQVIPAFLNMAKKNRLVLTEPDEWIAYL